ncbi:MAG: lysostaphin resistance A-like protein [Leifsonia sp.]
MSRTSYFFDAGPAKNPVYTGLLKLPKPVYGIVGVILFVVLAFGIVLAVGLPLQVVLTGLKGNPLLVGGLELIGSSAVLWIIFLIYGRRAGFRSVGFAPERIVSRVLFGILLGLLLATTASLLTFVVRGTAVTFTWQVVTTPAFWGGCALLFVAYVIQGGSEELVFRSMLPKFLARKYGAIGVIVLPTVAFSAAHIVPALKDPLVFLSTGMAGLLFALVAYASNSLWLGIAFHTAYNFGSSFLLAQLLTPAGAASATAPTDSAISSLVTAGVTLVGVIAAYLALRARRPDWRSERIADRTPVPASGPRESAEADVIS